MARSDEVKQAVEDRYMRDASPSGEERGQAADVLARMLYRDYPDMGWQQCQSMARQSVTYDKP